MSKLSNKKSDYLKMDFQEENKLSKIIKHIRKGNYEKVTPILKKYPNLIYENIHNTKLDTVEYLLSKTHHESCLQTIIDIVKYIELNPNKPYLSILVKNKEYYKGKNNKPIDSEYKTLIKLLVLHKKANVDATDNLGRTALFYSDIHDSIILVSNGINLNIQDTDGNTACEV